MSVGENEVLRLVAAMKTCSQKSEAREAFVSNLVLKGKELCLSNPREYDHLLIQLLKSADSYQRHTDINTITVAIEVLLQIELNSVQFSQCNNIIRVCLRSADELSAVHSAVKVFGMALERNAPRDIISKQINDSLIWMSYDGKNTSEFRRTCGVMTLYEIVRNIPIMFIPHISTFFENAWPCLMDSNTETKTQTIRTFRAVIELLNTRPKDILSDEYSIMLRRLLSYLDISKGAEDYRIIGALSVFELVVMNAKTCVESRYDQLATIVDLAKKIHHHNTRNNIYKAIPVLAKYNKDIFIKKHLKDVIVLASEASKREAEVREIFSMISDVIRVVRKPHINAYIDTIIMSIKQTITAQKKHHKPPVWEALTCLATICRYVPIEGIEEHVLSCIDTVYSWGLSREFIKDMRIIINFTHPNTQKILEDNVLDIISVTLCGLPFRQRKDNANELVALGKYNASEEKQEMLALNALIEFKLTNSELMGDFLRDSVVPFIDSAKVEVRYAAIDTISRLLIPQGEISVSRRMVINAVVPRMLITASADSNLSIRLAIVRSFTPKFYTFLSEAQFLNFFLTSLSDEAQEIRLESLGLLCRMVGSNRSHILPALRKELIAVIHTLTTTKSFSSLEEGFIMLEKMATIVPYFVADFIDTIASVIQRHLVTMTHSSNLLIPFCNCLASVAGEAFAKTGIIDEAVIKLCNILTFITSDRKATAARISCLKTISCLLKYCGNLDGCYKRYEGLYKIISGILLNVEEQVEARIESLKIIGVIGAQDPLRLADLEQSGTQCTRHAPLISSEVFPLISSAELTHPICARVVLACMSTLFDPKDNRLASTNEALIKASIKTILTMCERRCVSHLELETVFPSIIAAMLTMKKTRVYCTILFELSTLIKYAGISSLKHEDKFRDLVEHIWSNDQSLRFTAVNLCCALALVNINRSSKHHAFFVPLMLDQLLEHPSSDHLSLSILHFFMCAGGALQSLAKTVISTIVALLEKATTEIEYASQLIGVLLHLARNIAIHEFASALIRTVCSKITQYYQHCGSAAQEFSPLVRRGIGIFIIIQHQIKGEFLKFIPTIQRVFKMHRISHKEYNFMCSQVIRGKGGKFQYSSAFSEELRQDYVILGEEFSNSILRAVEAHGEVWGGGSGTKISILQECDTTFLNVNEAIVREKALARPQSKEEFSKWLDELTIVVLRESPYNVFRCLSIAGANSQSLAERAPLFVHQIFAIAFRALWLGATGELRSVLTYCFQCALQDPEVTDDVVLCILSVAEHMDIAGTLLPISAMALSFTADQKGVSAKALHWIESVYYAAENPEICIGNLFSLYSKLGHIDSAISLLSKTGRGGNLTCASLIKLGRYAEALRALSSSEQEDTDAGFFFAPKVMTHQPVLTAESDESFQIDSLKTNFQSIENEINKILCLNQLGEMHLVVSEWKNLNGKFSKIKQRDEDEEETFKNILAEVAPYVADAAVRLKSWDVLSEALKCIPKQTNSSFYIYSAALSIHQEKLEEAQQFVSDGRRKLLDECSALLHESYTRAYDTIVIAQQLVELEETIEVLRIPNLEKRREATKILSNVWTDRINCVSPSVPHWKLLLQTRGLLVPEKEDVVTRVKFAKLCREQADSSSFERFTLEHLLGSRPNSLDDLINEQNNPIVVLEYIKYLSKSEKLFEGSMFGDEKKILRQLIDVYGSNPSAKGPIARMYARCGFKSDPPEAVEYFNKATQLDPNWFRGWRFWAEINTQQLQDSEIWSLELCVNAIKGYLKSIELGPSASTIIPDLLKLLSLWTKYCDPNALDVLRKQLRSVSVETWMLVIPQLIARLDTGSDDSCELVADILSHIAKENPNSLIYALIVCTSSQEQRRKKWAEEILNRLYRHNNNHLLVTQGRMVSSELIRISMIIHEQWHDALETAAKSLEDIPTMVHTLVKMHDEMDNKHPETVAEVEFRQKFGRMLSEAKEWLKSYSRTEKIADLNCAWQIYHYVYRQIDNIIKSQQTLGLYYTSPKLFEARNLQLTILHSEGKFYAVNIACFAPTLRVLQSKQRPKRICILGSDGSFNSFLLKGREDLRLDERVMQLLKLVNTIFCSSSSTNKETGYQVQRYAVTPLGHSVGVIGWVNKCDTMHELIKSHRIGRHITPELEIKLMGQIITTNQPKAYDMLCVLSKVEVLEILAEMTSGHDLRKAMWASSTNSETWLERRTTYTRSLATMSVVGYILGLGDRHPNNIMIQRSTGKVVHIDFGDCFEVAMTREKFPEKVPFRLTRMLRNALEISGEEGMFRSSAESVMTVLRENSDSVIAMLDAFVQDPLISWRLVQPVSVLEVENDPLVENVPVILGNSDTENPNLEALKSSMSPEMRESFKAHLSKRQSYRCLNMQMGRDDYDEKAVAHEGVSVMRRLESKLRGKEFSSGKQDNEQAMHPKNQVRRLITEATDITNVAQSWSGWYPFW